MDNHRNDGMLPYTDEDNDLLLQQFFSAAASQQLADDGFSQRVMRRLPQRTNWYTRLWTLGCIAVFAVLFIVLRGWEVLAVQLEVLLRTLPTESFTINPLMLAGVFLGLLLVGAGEAVSRA